MTKGSQARGGLGKTVSGKDNSKGKSPEHETNFICFKASVSVASTSGVRGRVARMRSAIVHSKDIGFNSIKPNISECLLYAT